MGGCEGREGGKNCIMENNSIFHVNNGQKKSGLAMLLPEEEICSENEEHYQRMAKGSVTQNVRILDVTYLWTELQLHENILIELKGTHTSPNSCLPVMMGQAERHRTYEHRKQWHKPP